MKKVLLNVICLAAVCICAAGQDFNRIPFAYKWIDNQSVAFSYNGTFEDTDAFLLDASSHEKTVGVKYGVKYFASFPEGLDKEAVNPTWSPDSSRIAYTKGNNLYWFDVTGGKTCQVTYDGSETILNGYASWVYYEEIFGRPSRYRAFWWSPDSRKLGFYRFDNTDVPVFPIYSPSGQDGRLNNTRYPKCGETNPKVRIGIVEANAGADIVWADFNENEDQYFGTPFWGRDSRDFYVSREPRLQNSLELFAVSATDGSKKSIYSEHYDTWLDWIDGILFTDAGLYMARSFETGWQQIYFLSYDGKDFRRLTSGPNWRINLLRVEEKTGDVYFMANRDATVRTCLYKVDSHGDITALTDTSYNASNVVFSPDGKYFVAGISNFTTPTRLILCETAKAELAWKANRLLADSRQATGSGKRGRRYAPKPANSLYVVADSKGESYDADKYALPELVYITNDGLKLPGYIVYPLEFDPNKKYPVHIDIYGGPDNPVVRDRWIRPNSSNQWWSDHGIIEMYVDCRAAGHNGREGLDQVYRQLTVCETQDYVAWAKWLRSLPYVDADRIGVEGFSFGGSMTALLLFSQSEYFRYGIAGGGVYDWALYDTHYTERYMDTPQANPEGYKKAAVINSASLYPTTYSDEPTLEREMVMIRLTHGTGDDNVHFQNTLQLIDALQRGNKKFELMIYPDGMHGYRGHQGLHDTNSEHEFWLKYLCR